MQILKTNPKNKILMLTSYPPRTCGIATYSTDLRNALLRQFSSFSMVVCALEEGQFERNYPDEVQYILKSTESKPYRELADKINEDDSIKMLFIQHEFGLFGGHYGDYLLTLMQAVKKPISITFHTVLPNPNDERKKIVQVISSLCDKIIVMTKNSSQLLEKQYEVSAEKIAIIPHGTHSVPWKRIQENKINGTNNEQEKKFVLSTFGLLSSNKSIETAIKALPKIIEQFPNVTYLVLGKTHPSVVEREGERYRDFLHETVRELDLEKHVQFVDKYLDLKDLLNYLCLTDIYLFTSKDPNQAVSGTFAYAMGSQCPVISTPIPHASEVLNEQTGIIVDFEDSNQFAESVIKLLDNNDLRNEMGRNAFHQTRTSLWHNTSVKHATIFHQLLGTKPPIYRLPEIKLEHINALTDSIGMIQFSDIHMPDNNTGYTLDDNTRALIAICMHFNQRKEKKDIALLEKYLNFIAFCQQANGRFLNSVDKAGEFHIQNSYTNLEDSNGRAIWALGVLIAHQSILPQPMVEHSKKIMEAALENIEDIQSPRAMAFVIKGLYFYKSVGGKKVEEIAERFANKLLERYNIIADTNWKWFEEYLTYANSVLPEAMLYAFLITKNISYKLIAHASFEFLLSHTFKENKIKVISNRGWFQKGRTPEKHGEQPIDVSYTIQALSLFYWVFKDESYRDKMETAFSWFLGNNHLNQVLYSPTNGGCYDGLEKDNVNLNQGAESTVCYLIARLFMEQANGVSTSRPRRLQKKELVYSTSWSKKKQQPKKLNMV